MKKNKGNKKGKGKFLVKIIKFIIFIIAGTIYFIYFIIKNLHNLIGNAFMKLPRITKVMTIYTMVFCAGFGLVIPYFTNDRVEIATIKTMHQLKLDELNLDNLKIKNVYAKTKPKVTATSKFCKKYSEIECKIFKTAKKHGLSTNQGYMLMAISKHETGNWTSSIFKNYHNMGGIIGSNGFRQYASLDEGIEDFVNLLDKYYINNGRNTIELIGAKYCPVGASNDPTGLNQHWVPQVTKYYNEYIH